jgi:hypothetical protein
VCKAVRECSHQLTTLDLSGINVSDRHWHEGLSRSSSSLTNLKLSNCSLNDEWLHQFRESYRMSWRNVHHLAMASLENETAQRNRVSDRGLALVTEMCPSLISINLTGLQLTDKAMDT